MGSPAMNFVPATVVEHNGSYALELQATNSTVVPFPKAEKLATYVGKSILLGLRPEMITEPQPHKEGAEFVTTANVEVEVTEPMGADTMVITRIDDAEVNCRCNPAYPAAPGKVIELMFDTSKAVAFDEATGQRIDV
jgi:multiple sugar transport system ATP-binding protein